MDRIYECSILLFAAWTLLSNPAALRWQFLIPLSALGLWGFAQLAVGATVDREATWSAAFRFAGLAATALAAYGTFGSRAARGRLLEAIAWFGFLLSVVAVLAYYTSPGRIFWVIEAPYPDVWGPFLSRNNFAQFLELTLPVALWLTCTRGPSVLYGSMAAVMLAAGFASASRAGAMLLAFETFAVFAAIRATRWKHALLFASAVVVLAGIAGAQTLIGRFGEADPLAYRDQIYQSTIELVESRPLAGYGLGTYAWVYPRFALRDFGYRIEHAHNDWLEWTAEGGLGFTAMWAWLLLGIGRKLPKHSWAWGIPGLFVHALVDFPVARLGVAAWAFILIGAIEASETRPPPF